MRSHFLILRLEIARHPQKYSVRFPFPGDEIDHDTRRLMFRSGIVTALARVATPTSIMIWLGAEKRQICQRSTGTSSARPLPRKAAFQNGGAMMFSI